MTDPVASKSWLTTSEQNVWSSEQETFSLLQDQNAKQVRKIITAVKMVLRVILSLLNGRQ